MNALVAGASSTGTSACVERLREEGMTVLACDARDVEQALDRLDGRLDVLVTISDRLAEGSIEAISEAGFRELLEANLSAAFRVSRACFSAMRAKGGGSMIYVGSDVGIRAEHEVAAYSVACAGVIALAELFAAEGAPHGIRSNAVCPRAGVDVASVIAWLASSESAHLSGATLRVDDAAGAAMVLDTRS
jgi:NAD(P)-dependent dehydrogenase (short-subunit alcohol dehydrogenase family)